MSRNTLWTTGSFWRYTAGASLSTSHLSFVPFIATKSQALMEANKISDANASLDECLSLNKLRMLTIDLAAWVSLAIAVTKTL